MGGQRANKAVFDRVRVPVDALLGELITARRADPDLEEHADILSMLLAGTDMDDATLKDELLTLLVAGHETTATALAWALERLARHPGAWERLREGRRRLPRRRVQGDAAAAARAAGRHPHAQGPVRDRGLRAARGRSPSCRRSTSSTPARTSIRTRSRSGRSASWRSRPAPTRGSRSAAACAAASARPSRCIEMKWVLRAIADAVVELQPGSPHAEDTKHRSITLAPKADGRVIVARRTAPVRRAQPVPSGR